MKKFLIVGRGLVGSFFKDVPECDVLSHEEWYLAGNNAYRGIVCAAAMSTEPLCQSATMAEVLEANVSLPLRILKLAKARDMPCVFFSTAGVYRSPGVRSETDDISSHNRYTASKVMMEYALQSEAYHKTYIFRIPFVVGFTQHPTDFEARIRKWEKCEDTNGSIVYRGDITRAVTAALTRPVAPGIYNIASGIVNFPRFLEDRFNWRGDIVPAGALSKTPNCQISTSKAKAAGLLES